MNDYILFILVAALGSYIQTQTGFAMGLILISGAALFDIADMSVITLVVSLLAIVNATMAIHGGTHFIALRPFLYMLGGALPSALLGLWLLQMLDGERVAILKLLLGSTLIISSLLLMFKPKVQQDISGHAAFGLTGIAAGLIGGLFATFGPPLTFMLYRQPMALMQIRNTLLAIFLVMGVYRTLLVTVQGGLTAEPLILAAMALPVVIVVTLLAGRYKLPLKQSSQLHLVYILLILMGCSLVFDSYSALL